MTSRKDLLNRMKRASELCELAKWEAYESEGGETFAESIKAALEYEDEMRELRDVADVLGVETAEMDDAMIYGIEKAYEVKEEAWK